jgi:hypothetical protein
MGKDKEIAEIVNRTMERIRKGIDEYQIQRFDPRDFKNIFFDKII